MSETDTQRRIELPGGDYLIPDPDYCQQELDGTTRRTVQKYGEPLPRVLGGPRDRGFVLLTDFMRRRTGAGAS
jgi:hypothetical protein